MAYSRGFVIEFIKLVGILNVVFFSFHYYARIAESLSTGTGMPLSSAEATVLIILVLLILVAFKFIRDGILVLFKIEPHSTIEKTGALFFGIARAVITASLLLTILVVAPSDYTRRSVAVSNIGAKFLYIAPSVYAFVLGKVVVKFSPDEQLNTSLFESLKVS